MLVDLTPEQCDWIAENAPFQVAALTVDGHCPHCGLHPSPAHDDYLPTRDCAPVPYLHNHPDNLARGALRTGGRV